MLWFKSYLASERNVFYILLFFTIVVIFFTNPLLIYPYDIYTHLEWIDRQDITNSQIYTREIWHYVWANIFNFLDIDKSKIFLRAYIIHYSQVITIFFILFYTSKIIIRNLFIDISNIEVNVLAYWSTLSWFTIFATYSVHYLQVWIMWYSVNYQITLPLALLTMALSVSIILEKCSKKQKIFYFLLILFFSYIILKVHAMEYIYYLMYMSLLILIHLDKILKLWRKNIYYSIPFTLLIFFLMYQFIQYIKTTSYQVPTIFSYISIEKIPELIKEINNRGTALINYYTRYNSSINEFTILSLILITFLLIIVIYRYIKNYKSIVNIRMVIFLFMASLFIFIPLTKITGGIASLLTYTTVVYRFYYSSLLFFALPVVVFYLFYIFKIKRIYMFHIVISLSLLGTFYYSKHISSRHIYYHNIMSIKNSFNKEIVGFNLTEDEIIKVGESIKYYESINKSAKEAYYYARDDIAFVIKFIYRKKVLYMRRGNLDYRKSYLKHNSSYYPVLFKTPKGFPSYERFK